MSAMPSFNMRDVYDAIRYNDKDQLKERLSTGRVDVNRKDQNGWSLLHRACQYGSVDCVKVLLDYENIKINITGPRRTTPLFTAITYNQIDCVKVLLNNPNINVNIRNQDEHTPIHHAILLQRIEGIKLLATHPNISLYMLDGRNKTPVDCVKESNLPQKTELLKLLGEDVPVPRETQPQPPQQPPQQQPQAPPQTHPVSSPYANIPPPVHDQQYIRRSIFQASPTIISQYPPSQPPAVPFQQTPSSLRYPDQQIKVTPPDATVTESQLQVPILNYEVQPPRQNNIYKPSQSTN